MELRQNKTVYCFFIMKTFALIGDKFSFPVSAILIINHPNRRHLSPALRKMRWRQGLVLTNFDLSFVTAEGSEDEVNSRLASPRLDFLTC